MGEGETLVLGLDSTTTRRRTSDFFMAYRLVSRPTTEGGAPILARPAGNESRSSQQGIAAMRSERKKERRTQGRSENADQGVQMNSTGRRFLRTLAGPFRESCQALPHLLSRAFRPRLVVFSEAELDALCVNQVFAEATSTPRMKLV